MEDNSLEYALLDTGDAFLGHITPELRAIVVDCNDGTFYGYVYYDGQINKDQIDWWKGSISEGGLRFNWCEFEVKRLDHPQEIPLIGRYVYLRKENGSPAHKGKELHLKFYLRNYGALDALLVVQSALLGCITPELRMVIVDVDDKNHFYLRFYHDGEISTQTRALWEIAMNDASKELPFAHTFDGKIERLDFPKEPSLPEAARYAYRRKECKQEVEATSEEKSKSWWQFWK